MLPVLNVNNDWLKSANPSTALGMFPPNLAHHLLPEELQKKIMLYIYQHYIWPQVLERQVFEPCWQKINDMYRIKLDKVDLSINEATPTGRSLKEDDSNSGPNARIADSVVYDAIERLTDVTHFISWKGASPIQYNVPPYYDSSKETNFYHPLKDKLKAANALLQWNMDNEEVYRKHFIASRQFYTFGVCFAKSEFMFQMQMLQRMTNLGQQQQIPQITKIGTSFEPISVWKLWMNWRLSAHETQFQPCPFFYEETPRFAMLQNQYDPRMNPMGFANLDKIVGSPSGPGWLYSGTEMNSFMEVLKKIPRMDNNSLATIPQILDSKFSVEALWTLYPLIPLDPVTLDWEFYSKGSNAGQPVPFNRYLMQTWGENLLHRQIILRLQRNFYPRDQIPIYGTAHMPDLESGLYPPSLGYLLWNHYREIVTCRNQYMLNKDRINDPPAWVQSGSPAANVDLNAPGARTEVSSKNDFGWADVVDATQTVAPYITMLREQAKTASKSDDAILGKALGGRTSATEAQNIFQASMSALTTPINLFNYDMMGGYAVRHWEYAATWMPPELLRQITGQMGFALSPEDLWLRVGLKWDVASTYIESIVRQQNIQFMLQSSFGDPSINRAPLWRELLTEWRFNNVDEIINDGGLNREVYEATDQAARTFMGEQVLIDPSQNHQIAIEVKKSIIEDRDNVWMKKYPERAPILLQQIFQHMKFLELQARLIEAQRQANRPIGGDELEPPPEQTGGGGQAPLSNQQPITAGGQIVQRGS